ncbi:anhydro-N-acetylmuramic acid kinase [Celeribacter indicus]|uniref:Anhydro-N-acetylmuramic acid kinase n=1 Tax=Celeribacter indicus TaxID=1208324 RepID=A0A0B5DSB3_9RHOB|nr:anhydro-N-acetylmuramic acid kinase [Celeribacter indicus]AJE46428.1 anhydro-N-acetylmuramic acid kinase [Celeribacter indicus]SDW56440.1 anhydro-N-acetylmuramic acid kinase [Celeribacter indicus]
MQGRGKGEAIRVAGCMSGTSLDGVDVATILTDGREILGFGDSACRPYGAREQALLREGLGTWEVGPEITELIETAHAEALSQLEGFDLIGFHGQTFNHAPEAGRTFQAGDGAVLAELFDVPVVWDFRSADMRLGGQGAPLAPFYHHALARHIGATAPVAFLNMGGVGNITWADPSVADPAAPGALLAFDTGPANAPVNDLVAARLGLAFDAGGALAARGTPEMEIVAAGLANPYFFRMPPKSLDRNAFHGLLEAVAPLSDADAAATLTAFSAAAVARAMDHCPTPPAVLHVTGGGRHNATLMAMIAAAVDCPVRPVEEAGLDGDMLEAQAFAYLAARVIAGLPTSAPGTTGVRAAIGGGRISRPAA